MFVHSQIRGQIRLWIGQPRKYLPWFKSINSFHSGGFNLKVLDKITFENKFCLNFKIKSVFIQVAHPKWKNYRFESCFEVVGENDAYVIYFLLSVVITLNCWHVFDYFILNTQLWNAKFQDMKEKNMSHLSWY